MEISLFSPIYNYVHFNKNLYFEFITSLQKLSNTNFNECSKAIHDFIYAKIYKHSYTKLPSQNVALNGKQLQNGDANY